MKKQILIFFLFTSSFPLLLSQKGENQLHKELQNPDSTYFVSLNDVKQISSSIGKLRNLTQLELHNQGGNMSDTLTLPKELLNCTKLNSLLVRGYFINNLEILAELEQLETIDLISEESNLKSMLQDVVSFRSLRILNVGPLSEIPATIFKLKELTHLYLGGDFVSIPSQIWNLQKLVSLSIYAPIQTIPNEITLMDSLKIIEIESSEMTHIPSSIFKISHLAKIRIYNTPIKTIPKDIAKAKCLESLCFSKTNISSIPAEITELEYLTRLLLSNNQIESIPEEIKKCELLEILDLRENRIAYLPRFSEGLFSLKVLLLGGNKIREIPKRISQLNHLQFLDLSQNQIEEIPELKLISERYFGICLIGNPIPQFQLLDFQVKNSHISFLPISFFGTHNTFIEYLKKLSFE